MPILDKIVDFLKNSTEKKKVETTDDGNTLSMKKKEKGENKKTHIELTNKEASVEIDAKAGKNETIINAKRKVGNEEETLFSAEITPKKTRFKQMVDDQAWVETDQRVSRKNGQNVVSMTFSTECKDKEDIERREKTTTYREDGSVDRVSLKEEETVYLTTEKGKKVPEKDTYFAWMDFDNNVPTKYGSLTKKEDVLYGGTETREIGMAYKDGVVSEITEIQNGVKTITRINEDGTSKTFDADGKEIGDHTAEETSELVKALQDEEVAYEAEKAKNMSPEEQEKNRADVQKVLERRGHRRTPAEAKHDLLRQGQSVEQDAPTETKEAPTQTKEGSSNAALLKEVLGLGGRE